MESDIWQQMKTAIFGMDIVTARGQLPFYFDLGLDYDFGLSHQVTDTLQDVFYREEFWDR